MCREGSYFGGNGDAKHREEEKGLGRAEGHDDLFMHEDKWCTAKV